MKLDDVQLAAKLVERVYLLRQTIEDTRGPIKIMVGTYPNAHEVVLAATFLDKLRADIKGSLVSELEHIINDLDALGVTVE